MALVFAILELVLHLSTFAILQLSCQNVYVLGGVMQIEDSRSRISHLKHPQMPGQCPTLPALDASSGGSPITSICQSSGISGGAALLRHATGKMPPQPYACSNPLVASGQCHAN
jgi:hypothetical protein